MCAVSHVHVHAVNVWSGMHLLVIRHGIAEERSLTEDDANRRLTPGR